MAELVDVIAESDEDVAEILDVSSGDEAPMDPAAPPRRFHEYRRGRELGRGASGAVFACRREYCQGRFAVKAIDLRRIRLGANAQRQQMLLCREVEILRTLPPHPNIVRLVDAFEEGPWFLMVLERVMGGDLFSALTARSTQRFLDAEAAHVTRQIAEGLAFLHRQNVIHRDLKLENVLVASERRQPPFTWYSVKITDFGLSKDVSLGMSGAHSLVGTRPYTAPEVELKNAYGASSDVWCLGILAFIMLTGRFPFQGIPSQQSALDRLVAEVDCGQRLRSLVSGLLRLDPASRLSLGCVCSEVSEALVEEGCEPEGSLERDAKRPRTGAAPGAWTAGAAEAPVEPAEEPAPEEAAAALPPVEPEEALAPVELAEVPVAVELAEAPACIELAEVLMPIGSVSDAEERAGAALVQATPPAEHGVAQHYVRTEKHARERLLAHLLDALDFDQAIVFANSVQQAACLEELLAAEGFAPLLVHAGLDPAVCMERRQRFLDFGARVLVSADLEGEGRVLVSTDLLEGCTAAARLNLVVNFDAPSTPGQYLARMGQEHCFLTSGCVITFVLHDSEAAVLEEVEAKLHVSVSPMLARVGLGSEARA